MTNFPESHRYLLETKNATLATLGRDGFPQQTEVWFLYEEGELGLSLNTSRLKTKNLRKRPQCSLFILDLENPFKYLEVRANAMFEGDDDFEYAKRVGAKYGGADLRDHDAPGDKRVKVTLEPVNIYPVDMTVGQS